MGVSGDPRMRARSTGIKVQAAHKYNQQLTDPGPGKHMWSVVGMWGVQPTPEGSYNLDLENLLTIEGPGCFKCETPWSPELAARPCTGNMT